MPFEPPTISSNTFGGIDSSIPLFVLNIDAYNNADYWNQFTNIQSLSVGLVVKLPSNTTDGRYKDCFIEVASKDGIMHNRSLITDKVSYIFGVAPNGSYNVSVVTGQGAVLGEKKNIEVNDEDVTVTFSSLKQPQAVSMAVTLPEGEDVTDQVAVTWTDTQGQFLAQNNMLSGLVEGMKVNYEVKLPQELAATYVQPALTPYTVKASGNSILVQLQPFGAATFIGTVRDASNGSPLQHATVTVSQTLNGKQSRSFNATTDTQGKFSLEAFTAPSVVNAAAQGYVSQMVELPQVGGVVTLDTLRLSPITGAVIRTDFTYRASVLQGEQATTLGYYDDYANVSYTLRNKTKGKDISQFSVQYPDIVLLEDVNEGDQIVVTAHSIKGVFNDVSATCTVQNDRGTVTLPIVEHGGIVAKYNQTQADQVVGIVYDNTGEQVQRGDYRNATLQLSNLKDGKYTLITMQASEYLNSVLTLNALNATGLKAGTDYVSSSVNVSSGMLSPITITSVPALDESQLYYTSRNTHFTANKTSVTIGNYMTLTANVDFKEDYQGQVRNVQLLIDLPQGCEFVANSLLIGGDIGAYNQSENRINVSLPNEGCVVKFCAMPTLVGEVRPSASVRFTINGKQVTQPIGSPHFEAKALDIRVPHTTTTSNIIVSGHAPFNSNVEVFDGDKLIGITTSSTSTWFLNCTLADSLDFSVHSIQACATTMQGVKLYSQSVECVLNSKLAVPKSISMIYNSYESSFYPQELRTTGGYYSYVPGLSEFTFLADFNIDNPERLLNVRFNVLATDGGIRTFPATFDQPNLKWVAQADYPNSSSLPINVNVSYLDTLPTAMDFTQIHYSDIQTVKQQVNKGLDLINEKFSVRNIADGADVAAFDCVSDTYGETWKCHVSEQTYSALVEDMNNSAEYYKIFDDNQDLWVKGWISEGAMHMNLVDRTEHKAFKVDLTTHTTNQQSNGPRKSIAILASPIVDFVFGNLHCHQTKKAIDYYINGMIEANEHIRALYDLKCDDGTYLFNETTRKEILSVAENNDVGINSELYYFRGLVDQSFGDAIARTLAIDLIVGKLTDCFKYIPNNMETVLNKIKYVLGNVSINVGVNAITSKANDLIFGNYYDVGNQIIKEFATSYEMMQSQNMRFIKKWSKDKRKCNSEEKPEVTPEDFNTPPVVVTIDPSGFVYEAVPSNRLQGVTATIYYKETVEDMYGDPQEHEVMWDAEEYAQENPLFTDENGMYQWDVPQGLWQVRFSKNGYEPTQSEWLPVPPPQLDVNIGMTQLRQPEVEMVHAYKDGVELTFDKFMRPATLTTDNILVTQNGKAVDGTIELMNEEAGDNEALASKVRFMPSNEFTAKSVKLTVKNAVESYAGVRMNSDFTQTFDIEKHVRVIAIDTLINVGYGESRQVKVQALPADIAGGKTLRVQSRLPIIANVEAETYKLDKHGRTNITVDGNLPGATFLTLSVDGFDLKSNAKVLVVDESSMVTAKPVASVFNGKVFDGTITVELSCETPDAVIYYTTNGACPCDDEQRKLYSGPIAISETTTLKAIAVAPNHYESDIATYYYFYASAVDDVKGDAPFTITPTLVTDGFKVMGLTGGCDVRLYAMNGAEVLHKGNVLSGEPVSMSHLAPGIYIAVVTANGRPYAKRIVKAN